MWKQVMPPTFLFFFYFSIFYSFFFFAYGKKGLLRGKEQKKAITEAEGKMSWNEAGRWRTFIYGK